MEIFSLLESFFQYLSQIWNLADVFPLENWKEGLLFSNFSQGPDTDYHKVVDGIYKKFACLETHNF